LGKQALEVEVEFEIELELEIGFEVEVEFDSSLRGVYDVAIFFYQSTILLCN
jgi:hypothetical protein